MQRDIAQDEGRPTNRATSLKATDVDLDVLDGRAARSAEQMRAEFGDAVSRQGPERDALIDALIGYRQARTQSQQRATPYADLLQAITAGGALATVGGVTR